MVDHYAVLGIDPSASPDEVRQAYRRAMRALHPDMNDGEDMGDAVAMANAAYAALSNPDARARYDRERAAEAPKPNPAPEQERPRRPSAAPQATDWREAMRDVDPEPAAVDPKPPQAERRGELPPAAWPLRRWAVPLGAGVLLLAVWAACIATIWGMREPATNIIVAVSVLVLGFHAFYRNWWSAAAAAAIGTLGLFSQIGEGDGMGEVRAALGDAVPAAGWLALAAGIAGGLGVMALAAGVSRALDPTRSAAWERFEAEQEGRMLFAPDRTDSVGSLSCSLDGVDVRSGERGFRRVRLRRPLGRFPILALNSEGVEVARAPRQWLSAWNRSLDYRA